MSYQVKFHFGVLSLVLLIISLLSISSIVTVYQQSYDTAEDAANELFALSANKVAHNMNTAVSEGIQTVEVLSKLPVFTNSIENEEDLHDSFQLLISTLKLEKWAYSVFFGHDDGTFVQVIAINGSDKIRKLHDAPETTTHIVRQIVELEDGMLRERKFYFDTDLQQTRPVKIGLSDFDARKRPWFTQAKEKRETITTDPYIFHSLGELGITCAAVFPNGKGVFALDYTFEGLKVLLSQANLSPNGAMYIIGDKDWHLRFSQKGYADIPEAENQNILKSFDRVIETVKAKGIANHQTQEIVNDELNLFYISDMPKYLQGKMFIGSVGPLSDFTGHIYEMRDALILLLIGITFAVIPLTYLVIRRMSRSLEKLEKDAKRISDFDFTETEQVDSSIREIQRLGSAFAMMKRTIRDRTQNLKEALDKLRKHEAELEEKVELRTQELKATLDLMNSSIRYASRIQRSILPSDQMLCEAFKDHFIFWEPRDVVGGDIYWARDWGKGTILCVGDCTGHGVPGAFMTLITTGVMEKALDEIDEGRVDLFLSHLNKNVQHILGQDGDFGESDDGMELGVCYIDQENKTIQYAGAKFNLFIAYGEEIEMIKPTRKGIGYRDISCEQTYEMNSIDVKEGMSFYMTSDGLIDQIGGPRRRAFGKKRFVSLLDEHHALAMDVQKENIQNAFAEYQGDEIRRDDILVVGFKL